MTWATVGTESIDDAECGLIEVVEEAETER